MAKMKEGDYKVYIILPVTLRYEVILLNNFALSLHCKI